MYTVPQRQNVLAPVTTSVDARHFRRKGVHLPVQRRRRARIFIGRPGRQHLNALQGWKQSGQELLTTQFDPAPLSVGDEHNRPQLLGDAQGLGRGCGHLVEAVVGDS